MFVGSAFLEAPTVQSLSHSLYETIPSMADILNAATQPDPSSTAALFGSLGRALGDHLAAMRPFDPDALDNLVGSLSSVIEAVECALDAEAGPSVQQSFVIMNMAAQHVALASQGLAPAAAVQEATTAAAHAFKSLQAAQAHGPGAHVYFMPQLQARPSVESCDRACFVDRPAVVLQEQGKDVEEKVILCTRGRWQP